MRVSLLFLFWPYFIHQESGAICAQIRSILRADAKNDLESALVEFHDAVGGRQAKGNVFAIARAAVQGKIEKLLIAEGVQIFGKLNRKSGDLKLNGRDLDHEDDDIMDDLSRPEVSHR